MHAFHISARASVKHEDREIEFHDLRDSLEIAVSLMLIGGKRGVLDLGPRSCETIGREILETLHQVDQVEVREDEGCEAIVTRTPVKPQIVTVCGSTKFKNETIEVVQTLTSEGHLVLAVGFFGHADKIEMEPSLKEHLDQLHLRKIDASDWIYVVNPGGYIGSSTANEIEHAHSIGIPVIYLETPEHVPA